MIYPFFRLRQIGGVFFFARHRFPSLHVPICTICTGDMGTVSLVCTFVGRKNAAEKNTAEKTPKKWTKKFGGIFFNKASCINTFFLKREGV